MASQTSDSTGAVGRLRHRLAATSLTARQALAVGLLLNLQGMAVVLYLGLTDAVVTEPRYVLYGLVWVNVGALAIRRASPPDAPFRARRRAVAVAAGYFALLAAVGGVVSPGSPEWEVGYRLAMLPPGWGPAFVFASPQLHVVAMPAYVVGYAALAYLVYVTVLDAAGSAVAGVLGLFSCVSCTWPVLAAVASSLVGGGTLLASSAMDLSYDLSTAVFLVTVALLYWRPGVR